MSDTPNGRPATLEDVRRVEEQSDRLTERFDAWLLTYATAHAELSNRMTALETKVSGHIVSYAQKAENRGLLVAAAVGGLIAGSVSIIIAVIALVH